MARHVTLECPGPPLTLRDLELLEREIGGRLPDDYKQFMLAQNGGFPTTKLGLMWQGEMESILDFESLMPLESTAGLRGSLEFLRELNPVTTKGFVPVASPGEDYICLATRGNIGAVFHTVYTYKTVYESDLVPVDVTMVPLASSFTEFLDSLIEIREPYCRIHDLGKQGTSEDLARYLAEGNSINAPSKNKLTVVCEAVAADNLPMIRACIERGASLSGTVHAAVQFGQTHLVEMLVKAGADINERDESGSTPLSHVGGWGLPGKEGARNRKLRNVLIKLGAVE